MAIWVIKEGQREGPYEEQDVRELIYEGTYTDADAAIRDGQFDWSTLGQVLGRQPVPSEPPPAPPPPTVEPPPLLLTPEQPPLSAAPEPEPELFSTPVLPQEFPSASATSAPIPVTVTDFQMPFGSMVIFMVKLVIASIPALLILFAVAALFWTLCLAFIAFVAILLHH